MTKGTHLLRSALLALLALAVISGGSLAAGDLFDDDYLDCPTKTRLRDGQISDLMVARDSDEEDEVNVSWSATDASSWGLGPNAFDTSLVVILNDGTNHTETMKLGQRKVTFDDIETGKVVKVQMAIVVDHADGDYLISDILEQSLNQSLTEPSFSTAWNRVSNAADGSTTTAGFQIQTAAVDAGMMYYVGYNENFGNYKSDDSDFVTTPSTARLRIGLAHSGEETDDERDDVDFDAYKIRIIGEDGDVVSEGDDVSTVASSYGTFAHTYDPGTGTNITDTYDNQLVVYGVNTITFNTAAANPGRVVGTIGAGDYALSNVRIVDGSAISVAMHNSAAVTRGSGSPNPNTEPLSTVRVGRLTGASATTIPSPTAGTVYAAPPNEHRDFPIDTLFFTSDETYTIKAWALNDDDEVISPTVTLEVRPRDTDQGPTTGFEDYKLSGTVDLSDLITTEFTILK